MSRKSRVCAISRAAISLCLYRNTLIGTVYLSITPQLRHLGQIGFSVLFLFSPISQQNPFLFRSH